MCWRIFIKFREIIKLERQFLICLLTSGTRHFIKFREIISLGRIKLGRFYCIIKLERFLIIIKLERLDCIHLNLVAQMAFIYKQDMVHTIWSVHTLAVLEGVQ